MGLLLPSEERPNQTKFHKQLLEKRNELKELIQYEHDELCRSRELYWEDSIEFKRQQNRFKYTQSSYWQDIELFEEKVYGKQWKLF